MHHELKIFPTFFEAVIRGEKKFEIRDNSDRGFQKGDAVTLKEYREYEDGTPLFGRGQLIEITYVTDYNQPKNQVVFAFSLIGDVIEPNSEGNVRPTGA